MVCLDSDVLIDFLRNDRATIEKINKLRDKQSSLYITSINSFEIFKGLTNSKLSRKQIMEFLSNFNILNFDFQSSEKAAEIFNELKKEGKTIELPDVMIASIAIVNDESILTGNMDHFSRIKQLTMEESNN